MQIKSVGIIGGTGGLGARFAEYFKIKFPELEVLVSGRKTTITNTKIIQKCDLVIFAVPIDQTEAVIESQLINARADQIWADFTSIKQQPVEAMLKSKAQVCGLHPLFGALPEIEGQTLIYCPERIEPSALEGLLKLLAAFNLMTFSPSEHDDLMGVVQCASHMSDMVMGQTLRKSGFDFETIWQVSSPSYRLKLEVMGRMFAQNPDLYADIATQNLSAPHFTGLFAQATEELETIVEKGDRNLLIKNFDQTADYLTSTFCNQAYVDSQAFLQSYGAGVSATTEKQHPVNIAVFGEPGSHTDSASLDFKSVTGGGERRFYGSVFSLVEAVQSGQAQWGIVPYENTTEGSVLEVLDELLDHPDIQIVASTQRNIEQYLMTSDIREKSDITEIYSHPQALAQSKPYLRKHCPNAQLKAAASTSNAARQVKQSASKPWAAVGSKNLAESLDLTIVSPNMASQDNCTRFVLLQKNGQTKNTTVTSAVFWFNADKAGNLASVLSYFSAHNINLLKLDSRRVEADKGGFAFFVDCEISLLDFKVHLPALQKEVADLQILGGY